MILICPDSFKDAITSLDACRAIARGIESSLPDLSYQIFPISDGGEGFADVLDYHLNLKRIPCQTSDPLNRPIETEFLYDEVHGRTFFAMSQAAGLELLSMGERDPLHTTTYGVGVLIKACVDFGAKEIMIGIGGSATNDGGTGMAAALGWRFIDQDRRNLIPTGNSLSSIAEIIPPDHNYCSAVQITLLSDVDNPLLGPTGATHTYARQKGATSDGITILEEGMGNLNTLIKDQLGKQIANVPGAGAAGGFGAGALVFLNATLESGINKMTDLVGLRKHIEKATLVITGEGKLDAQTESGKLIHGITSICRENNVPVVAFCGQVESDTNALRTMGLHRTFSISEGTNDVNDAIRNTAVLLEKWVNNQLPQIMDELSLMP